MLVRVVVLALGRCVRCVRCGGGRSRRRLQLHALLQHGEVRGWTWAWTGEVAAAAAAHLGVPRNFGALATCVRLVAGEENVSLPLIENMKNLVGQNEACPNPAWLPVLAWSARFTTWLVPNSTHCNTACHWLWTLVRDMVTESFFAQVKKRANTLGRP